MQRDEGFRYLREELGVSDSILESCWSFVEEWRIGGELGSYTTMALDRVTWLALRFDGK